MEKIAWLAARESSAICGGNVQQNCGIGMATRFQNTN
jgi:hypothetical protein